MAPQICLVIGGVRSGKSSFAENKVVEFNSLSRNSVLYVATGVAFDEEMEDCIRRHRESRPCDWSTLDEPVQVPEKLSATLQKSDGVGAVIIDSIDVWVANLLMKIDGKKSIIDIVDDLSRSASESAKEKLLKYSIDTISILYVEGVIDNLS